jgi:TolB-like protein/DNA-binding winged helix-turn-helix (wHTH) protein/Flp pilus assembly protein TadD
MATASQTRRIRFGVFEVDLGSSELFKHGIRLKLQDQPFQILTILLERPGVLVSREELRRKLWADDTFVDFDAGMNAAIRRLRDALNDSADQPRYVQTLPRHGYRFIAEVESVPGTPNQGLLDLPSDSTRSVSATAVPGAMVSRRHWLVGFGLTAGMAVVITIGTVGWRHRLFDTHASSGIQSVAVLPLQNLSGDPSQDYFADGMTEALISDVAQIKSLRVISRTSSMHYKGTQEKLPQIAKELNVDAVVEGSVVRAGNRVRISAQLVEAPTDRHIWASAFERNMSDVLTLQDEVARAIASEVAANLAPQTKMPQKQARAVNPEAYEAYLKANYFSEKQSDEGFEKAKEYYEQSIHFDPTYAPAYVGLAEVFGWLAFTNRQPPADSWTKAESYLAKAFELDDAYSQAYVARGMVKLQFHCDSYGAEQDLTRAMELDPGNMSAVNYHSYYLLGIGRADDAVAEKRRVVARDPISVGTNAELGLYFLEIGRNDEAIEQLKKTLELDPNFAPAHMRLGLAYSSKGQFDKAVAEIKTGIALEKTPSRLETLGHVYVRSGRLQELPELIRELEDMSNKRYVSPSLIAGLYAQLGENDRALRWLEKARQSDDPHIDSPAFDSLRSSARFKALEARLKPPETCATF